MSFKIKNKDQKRLDAFLAGVLDAYADGEVDKVQAVYTLAHVITAAAIDNEAEVLAWLSPDQLVRWKEEAGAQRP